MREEITREGITLEEILELIPDGQVVALIAEDEIIAGLPQIMVDYLRPDILRKSIDSIESGGENNTLLNIRI